MMFEVGAEPPEACRDGAVAMVGYIVFHARLALAHLCFVRERPISVPDLRDGLLGRFRRRRGRAH